MIKLKRLNVVRIVDSEAKAARLEKEGFERLSGVAEPEKPGKPAAPKPDGDKK